MRCHLLVRIDCSERSLLKVRPLLHQQRCLIFSPRGEGLGRRHRASTAHYFYDLVFCCRETALDMGNYWSIE